MATNNAWVKVILPISYLYLTRIMGVFLFTPILSASVQNIAHATPLLIGIAIGIFGLLQAVFQIPFGIWSDKYGRKKLIAIGLFMYLVGSIIGIMSESIYTLILARAVQGFGAISAVLSALIVDLTSEQMRVKAFAFIGVMLAIIFMLCMVISPILVQHYGLDSLFYILSGSTLVGLFINQFIIPNPGKAQILSIEGASIKDLLRSKKLVILNNFILMQHMMVCSTFYAVPILLNQLVKNNVLPSVLYFYLPTLVFSFIFLGPLIAITEKYNLLKVNFLSCIVMYILLQFTMVFHPGLFVLIVLFTLYFTAFNFLEANMFTLISKYCPASVRGTAMGIFATYQFFGFFLGGLCAGIIAQLFSLYAIFIFNGIVSCIWFLYAFKLFKKEESESDGALGERNG